MFFSVMKSILAFSKCETKSEIILKQAFNVLFEYQKQEGEKHEMDLDNFENFITNFGEKFKYDEIETTKEFLNDILIKSKFNYETYIKSLCSSNSFSYQYQLNDFVKFKSLLNQKAFLRSLGFDI